MVALMFQYNICFLFRKEVIWILFKNGKRLKQLKICQMILDNARCDSWGELAVMTCLFVAIVITIALWSVKLGFGSPLEAEGAIVGLSMSRIVIGIIAMLTRPKN